MGCRASHRWRVGGIHVRGQLDRRGDFDLLKVRRRKGQGDTAERLAELNP